MVQVTLPFLALTLQSFCFVLGAHGHRITRRYFDDWSQPQGHSVNRLFKRGSTDGAQYPAVGSSEWSSKYPTENKTPDRSSTPKEWLDALNAAVAAGNIPNTPIATMGPNGSPVYPNNQDPSSPNICSSTYQCRSQDDIYDGPDGIFAVSFDDGPLPPTTTLVNFLKSNNEIATHFMIGYNILTNPQQFSQIFDYGGDCAVHTWSHPYMTTLSNEDVVAELGWTLQILHDSSGGRVAKMWRPPFGDSDVRVRAIAKHVFGMDTVIWNQDSADWTMNNGKSTLDQVMNSLDGFLKGPKSPGLIILEHESSDNTVKAFTDTYPKIKGNGWQTKSLIPLLENGDSYQNVKGDTVTPAKIYINPGANSTSATSSASSSSTSATSSLKPTTTPSSSSNRTVSSNASNSASASKLCTASRQWLFFALAISAALVVLS
ncbi:glycoside hydrolase/deacetylase [Marasmius fiardii PR-910]|nr:glycoside hydrolase/deacetylase [Marasmius fiardii PR-910]